MASQVHSPVDIPDDPPVIPWVASDWIGCGKRYPYADTPSYISDARAASVAIPPEYKVFLPNPRLSITDLLGSNLPVQSCALVSQTATSSFSTSAPNETLEQFWGRPIPPQEFIQSLEASFGQAWFDGALSIVDKRYKASRLPMYALTFWKEVARAIKKKAMWLTARNWLHLRARTPVEVRAAEEANALMEVLGWDMLMTAGETRTCPDAITLLLSGRWLDDDVVAMLLTQLSKRASLRSSKLPVILVAPCVFSVCITSASIMEGYGDEAGTHLKSMKIRITEQRAKELYLVTNINNVHWITFQLDFELKVIRYGDSLGKTASPPRKFILDLQKWTKAEFGCSFKDMGNVLPHGIQEDSSSCGVCSINTIAHNIFGDPLFTSDERNLHRMNLFNLVVRAQLDLLTLSSTQDSDVKSGEIDHISDQGTSRETSGGPNKEHDDAAPGGITKMSLSFLMSSSDVPRAATNTSWGDNARADALEREKTVESKAIDTSVFDVQSVDHFEIPSSPFLPCSSLPSTPGPSSPPQVLSPSPPSNTVPVKPTHAAKTLLAFWDPNRAHPGQAHGTKRARSASDGETYDASSKRRGPGTSASAVASRKLKGAAEDGTLQIDPIRYATYKEKIYLVDKHAQFICGKVWKVSHSVCEDWIVMKEPYHTTYFKKHASLCQAKAKADSKHRADAGILAASGSKKRMLDPGTRNRRIGDWFVPVGAAAKGGEHKRGQEGTDNAQQEARPISAPVVPCPGICPAIEPRVVRYFDRTIGVGGGGQHLAEVAKDLYAVTYADLTEKQKAKVIKAQAAGHRWRNEPSTLTVYSTSCLRTVPRVDGLDPHSHGLCNSCTRVLRLKQFRKALNVKAPAEHNYKFTNKRFLNELLAGIYAKSRGLKGLIHNEDSTSSIFARYASGVVEGKFAGSGVLNDLITAMVELQARNERGVGRQNFAYGQALISFANTCAIMSPQLYRIMATQFPLPSLRDLKRKQARVPRFPLTICEQTFHIAKQYLVRLGYTGPVAIACDDSKLLPSYRTYWDSTQQLHFLVGGVHGPMAVANVTELQDVLGKGTAGPKATKLRVWCMLPSVPGASTLILAVKPIPNSLSAPTLTEWSDEILCGLIQHNIWPISYACDGTETERCVQRSLISKSPNILKYKIQHPFQDCEPLEFEIATRGGRPIVMIQDNKHALKTGRNNGFTGGRTLVIGNNIVSYAYVRDIAFLSDSPLFNRDVEKIDRQDDNAACRLFSATILEYLTKKHPHYAGQIVFLFIIGELVDAYQNRRISHHTRVRMVLRARFFVEVWRAWLKLAGYQESRHFISREFADIMRILIDGLISLIVVHRDHMDGQPIPLCPWLHASEMVEHVFAELRKLVPDFTCLDVLFAIPRLHVLIREVLKLSRDGAASDPKATAAGYAHTFFDTRDMNLRVLAIFPTDTEIQSIAKEAWSETESLMDLVGICVADVMLDTSSSAQVMLPSVTSWFNDNEDNDGTESEGDPTEDNEREETDIAVLERLINEESHSKLRRKKDDERMTSLTCAAIATAVDQDVISQSILDPTDEELKADATVDGQHLAEALRDVYGISSAGSHQVLAVPNPDGPGEVMRPFDHPIDRLEHLDFDALVSTRRSHETWRAKHGVRVRGQHSGDAQPALATSDGPASLDGSMKPVRPESAKQVIAREMQSFLREQQDRGVSSGVGREIRWTGSVSSAATNGNSLNAALAAGQRATTVVKRRLKLFAQCRVPSSINLSDAMISSPNTSTPHHRCIQRGSYGLIVTGPHIMVCNVIALFSRGGGKTGTHSWYGSLNSIGLMSYASVQVYEPWIGQPGKFRAVHRRSGALQCYTFMHLPSDAFLRLLPGDQTLSLDKKILYLNQPSTLLFDTYAPHASSIAAATKALMKARRTKKGSEESDVE